MSSTDIYPSSNILPYVYLCTHRETGEYYIGYRFKNKTPSSEDIGKIYKTSSKLVSPRIDEFDCTVIAEFFTKEDAYDFEQELISESWGSPLLLNKSVHSKSSERFISTPGCYKPSELTLQKLSKSRTGSKRPQDTKDKMSASSWSKSDDSERIRSVLSSKLKGKPKSDDARARMRAGWELRRQRLLLLKEMP